MTPDEADGYLVPPLWLEAHNLSQEDLGAIKARFLAAVERGDPPKVIREPRFRLDRREMRATIGGVVAVLVTGAVMAVALVLWAWL